MFTHHERQSCNGPTVDYINWYKTHVVLLTGATGSLGSCLLYKLALQLPTSRIYVLCRGTINDAIQKWESAMPEQIDDILDSGKIRFIRGNMGQDDFGIAPDELERIQNDVTVVLHAAANISLGQSLVESIHNDCLPVVRLARLVQTFKKIKLFVHISSTFAQMHLPAGQVPERVCRIGDGEPTANMQLKTILATGRSAYAPHFITPYAQAKYLAEQLLLEFEDSFPILIIRPSSISPAVRDPFPLYAPDGAIPLHTFLAVSIARGYDINELINGLPQHYIFDEIPVDLVANVCLLHMAAGTTGIVHAASQLHVTLTIGDYVAKTRQYAPQDLLERSAAHTTAQGEARALPLEFHKFLLEEWRDWVFDCGRSDIIRATTGPLGLDAVEEHEDLFRERVKRWSKRFSTLLGATV